MAGQRHGGVGVDAFGVGIVDRFDFSVRTVFARLLRDGEERYEGGGAPFRVICFRETGNVDPFLDVPPVDGDLCESLFGYGVGFACWCLNLNGGGVAVYHAPGEGRIAVSAECACAEKKRAFAFEGAQYDADCARSGVENLRCGVRVVATCHRIAHGVQTRVDDVEQRHWRNLFGAKGVSLLREAHGVEASAFKGGGMGQRREVVGFGVDVPARAAQEPLKRGAHEMAADDGLLRLAREAGGGGERRAEEGLVGPGRPHGGEVEGGRAGEDVADVLLPIVHVRGNHEQLVV